MYLIPILKFGNSLLVTIAFYRASQVFEPSVDNVRLLIFDQVMDALRQPEF